MSSTQNMATGASNADLAIILGDSQNCSTNTKTLIICSILGIKNILLAVNKMDLTDYKKNVFDKIITDYKLFLKNSTLKILPLFQYLLCMAQFLKKSYKPVGTQAQHF